VSPKFGLSEAGPTEDAALLSETEVLCAHAISVQTQSSVKKYLAKFTIRAVTPNQVRRHPAA